MNMKVLITHDNGERSKATRQQLTQKTVNFLITLASERFNDPTQPPVERVQIIVGE